MEKQAMSGVVAPYRSCVLGTHKQSPISRSPTDYTLCRPLASRTFTFLVGPEKEAIDVHINLLQSLSEPLDKLMNNGQMKESTERVAVLEHVDVETFGLFAEFCYTYNYRAPPKAKAVGAVVQIAKGNPPQISLPTAYCYICGRYSPSNLSNSKIYCKACSPLSLHCVLCSAGLDFQKLYYGPVCLQCSKTKAVQSYLVSMSSVALRERLEAKKRGAMGVSYDELRVRLQSLKPQDEPSQKPIYHARLYVFANMYMIQPLKDLVLHKLSRDLEAFDFKNDSTGEFADLFRYVYMNTSGDDDDSMGTGSELRDLVVTYAASNAEFLVRNKAFVEVLEQGGEGASTFAVFMAKRL